MSESSVTDIDKELDRHQKRRDDNIPTVSVILGPPLLARCHWQEWSRKRSQPVAETNVLSLEQAVASWVEHLANHVDLVGEARKRLAKSLRKPVEEINSYLEDFPNWKRHQVLEKAFGLGKHSEIASVCITLLEDSDSKGAREGLNMLRAEWGKDAVASYRLLGALAQLCPNMVPSLFFSFSQPSIKDSSKGLASAEWIAALVEQVPALPVALAAEDKLFKAYKREAPETHAKGILTERTIRLRLAQESEGNRRTTTLRDKTTRRIEPALKTAISIGVTEEILDKLQQADQAIVKAKQLDDEHEFEKARSRAEAVFHQMLEICSDTAGLFELNGKVPEPQWRGSNMEVDLLCTSHRIAIELDGYHHFSSKAQYKLDRRKDFLLQKKNFFVIRLHAEDVLSDLPENLDMIRTAVRMRQNDLGEHL